MKINMMRKITILTIAIIFAAVMLFAGATQPSYADTEYTSVTSAGQYMMKQIVNHSGTIKISLASSDGNSVNAAKDVFNAAIDSSSIGDYYKYSVYDGYNVNWYKYTLNGIIHYDFTYQMQYKTTVAQEKAFEKKLNKTVKSLKLGKKSKYTKAKIIYKWITKHVKYDTKYSSSDVKYSAYSALNKGSAVCQGYSTLFYRMCKTAGISTKVITGSSLGEGHAWNIVKIGSKYYNVDPTWDAGNRKFTYFLKGSKGFKSHTRAAAFKTTSFNSSYPTSAKNY